MTATGYEDSINAAYLPPPDLWWAVEPLLPERKKKSPAGRKPASDQQMFCAIYYVLRTGIQWKALPRALGAASTVHDRFQRWCEAGVFYQLWELGLMELQVEGRLHWQYQSMDSCQTKAPLGGEAVGASPVDRAKTGVKRHLLTEAQGLPVGLLVTGANRHDKTQVAALLEQMPLLPPWPEQENEQHFCADKGYDYADVCGLISSLGYENQIKSRGQEASLVKTPGYRARRWVCERTHSWLNRYRRLLIRWEKKLKHYQAFLYLACALIVWKQSAIFG